MNKPNPVYTPLSLCLSLLLAVSAFGQEPNNSSDGQAPDKTATEKSTETAVEFPDLTIPAGNDVGALQKLVLKAKLAKPNSPEQYKSQQMAIKIASTRLLQLLDKLSPAYKQSEMDTIVSSVSLLTFFNDKEQVAVTQQVTDFLKSRKKLSIQDVQTGILTASMLELQPNKQPARDVYQLLDELLKEDEREEMQSLRINLQAAGRRLDMLGNKFELNALTIDGKQISTEQFAGNFVLVDFFATWCKPCLAEKPLIKSHYEKYKDKGLSVISISLDGEREPLNAFLQENPLPWPVIHDDAENPLDRLQLKYGVSMLPTVLLLNKEGTVVSLEARNAELNRLMEMLFEAPTPANSEAAKLTQDPDKAASDSNSLSSSASEKADAP